jgi:CheY-like chemotaxis protein
MSRVSVLIVEDDLDLAALLASHLRDEGFFVRLAHTGKDAVVRLNEGPFSPGRRRDPDMRGDSNGEEGHGTHSSHLSQSDVTTNRRPQRRSGRLHYEAILGTGANCKSPFCTKEISRVADATLLPAHHSGRSTD